MKTIIVNLYGGPGAGKSTLAAEVFYKLKSTTNLNIELVPEVAKESAWHGIEIVQSDCFFEQVKRIDRLIGKVNVIITDSPLLLQLIYGGDRYEGLVDVLKDTWVKVDKIKELNYFIERTKPYHNGGRYQSEHEAKSIDGDLHKLLNLWEEGNYLYDKTEALSDTIINDIKLEFKL